eukprot:gene27682-38118_t
MEAEVVPADAGAHVGGQGEVSGGDGCCDCHGSCGTNAAGAMLGGLCVIVA